MPKLNDRILADVTHQSDAAEAVVPEGLHGAQAPVQQFGALMVFERAGATLIQASTSVTRVAFRDIAACFGQPVDHVLDNFLGARIRQLTVGADERRRVTFNGKQFDIRLVGLPSSMLVELQPADSGIDATILGDRLDEVARALAHAATLSDVYRIACHAMHHTAGFAGVTLVRPLAGTNLQILAESLDDLLPSLSGRPETLAALGKIAHDHPVLYVADTSGQGVRLIVHSPSPDDAEIARKSELLALPVADLAPVQAGGIISFAILPVATEGRLWGYFLVENPFEIRFGQDRRRFGLTLGQLAAAAAERLQNHAKERAETLAPEIAATFLATVGDGTNPLEALLLGDRLLASTIGADGVIILSGRDCASVGAAPDPDAILAKLPGVLSGDTTKFVTDSLDSMKLFTDAERAGATAMISVRLAETPFMALAAFRGEFGADSHMPRNAWEPALIEAFYAVGAIFRRILLLGDEAAAVELSSQIGEFEEHAFGPGKLRSTIMAASASGMALLAGTGAGTYQIAECNVMFRRLFGLEPRETLSGTLDELADRLRLEPALLVDNGQHVAELELWSSELGPRIVEIDVRSIVRTRHDGVGRDLSLLQATDVTRIRRQEVAMRMARDQALALIRTREELLANMSHELRTPLNAVIGFAEMIAQQTLGPIGDMRYANYGTNIETAGRHLLALINDVLDLSRLNSGKHFIAEEDLDPSALLRSCIDWAKAASRRRDIVLTIDCAGMTPILRGDERALRQVMINLISNAVKFSSAEGKVEAALQWRPGNDLTIDVIDNGIGMSVGEVNRAFEPFFRGGGAYQRRIEGAGLGLAIAKGLVEMHGGSLTLISAEGEGTTVHIEIPAWRVSAST